MKNPKEQTLQEVLQWLTWYFIEFIIQESIMEIQLVKKDQAKEVNDEDQGIANEEVMTKKRLNFEAQDPLMEVNLRTEEEPRMKKISSLLPEESRDQLLQLIRRY